MLVSEMILTVVSDLHFNTTNEILNKVNNLYDLNLKYHLIHNNLTELRVNGKVRKRLKNHLEEWIRIN